MTLDIHATSNSPLFLKWTEGNLKKNLEVYQKSLGAFFHEALQISLVALLLGAFNCLHCLILDCIHVVPILTLYGYLATSEC